MKSGRLIVAALMRLPFARFRCIEREREREISSIALYLAATDGIETASTSAEVTSLFRLCQRHLRGPPRDGPRVASPKVKLSATVITRDNVCLIHVIIHRPTWDKRQLQ